MKHYISKTLKRITEILEFVISIILAVGIILLCVHLFTSLGGVLDQEVWPNYDDLLETCFNLIIGVELIRMMYSHTPDTVFEVLLFAIARQIIIDHSSIWSSLVGVCAIAVLFATRKYLFCEFDVSEATVFRANAKVSSINKLLGIDIPCEKDDTLLDVLSHSLEESGEDANIGACVYFNNFGLRVAKKHDGKISRIEVIRAIH